MSLQIQQDQPRPAAVGHAEGDGFAVLVGDLAWGHDKAYIVAPLFPDGAVFQFPVRKSGEAESGIGNAKSGVVLFQHCGCTINQVPLIKGK